MKCAVVGAGAWGTALANVLAQNGHAVTLWGHNPEGLAEIARTRRNERYLPGITLPDTLATETDLVRAVTPQDAVVLAVPSRHFREVTAQLGFFRGPVISVTKGIEHDSGLTMAGILAETMPHAAAAALSGPSLALEVARGIPAAVVVAQPDLALAREIQTWFMRPTFRVYTSPDLPGVELGGALKNVIAIAAGMSDGLGFGDNAKAALVTRAIVEIRRLGVAAGAQAETFAGLSGLGDLTVTCFSKLSRNRSFGERLGKGETAAQILGSTITVAEGYPTARSAWQLARKVRVETPIIDEIYAMLYEAKPIAQSLRDLLARDGKAE